MHLCRFGFAETTGKEEIEKAVKALDSKELHGRRLRVRAAGDKEKKPGDPGYKEKEKSRDRSKSRERDRGSSSSRRRNREVRVSDVKGHLTYAYIGFLEREMSEPGLNEEKKETMAQAIQVLKEAFDIPNDESLKVHLSISVDYPSLVRPNDICSLGYNYSVNEIKKSFSGPETLGDHVYAK